MANQQELLDFFYQSFSSDIGLLSGRDLRRTVVAQVAPTPIYDLTGGALFYDYDVVDQNGARAGIVRSSARSDELPLIDSILIGDQWFDAAAAIDHAKKTASQNIGPIQEAKFVCYGYPRIGVLVTCQTAAGSRSVVYDAPSGVEVRQWSGAFNPGVRDKGAGVPAASVEGNPFYSILSQIPEAGLEVSPASRQWGGLQAAFDRAAAKPFNAHRAVMTYAAESASGKGGVRFGIKGSLLPVSLYSQNTMVFCAVATAEMILSFFGVIKSQDEIAAAMSTDSSGTTNPNFMQGLQQLSSGKFTPRFIDQPAFTDFVQIIENLAPGKSGIPGHARLLRGWREYSFLDDQGRVLDREQFLIINDPYPTSSGQLVLECFTKPIPNFYANLVATS